MQGKRRKPKMSAALLFYVYILFRPWNGLPCYVGKGSVNGTDTIDPKDIVIPIAILAYNIFKRAGGELPAVIIRDALTEEQALKIEIALITAIGRKSIGGPLMQT